MPAELSPPACRLLMTVDAVGGVWHYSLDLAHAFAGSGVITTLALLGPPPSPAQRREAEAVADLTLIETGLPLDWTGEGAADARLAAEGVSALAGKIGADLIQLNGCPLASLAAFPAPVIAVHHSCLATWWASVKGGPLPAEWRWHAELTRSHFTAVSRVVTPSAALADLTASVYSLCDKPLVVRNGRSPGPTASNGDVAPALFTVGRLWDEGKNIATLDRAAARLDVPVFAAGPVRGPNGSVVACGELELLGELGSEEVRVQLAKRPIFVSAARYEPFGLAVLEAAQAGCALILSDIPSFRELWQDAAFFVEACDDAAVALAAERLLHDERLRRRMGDAARARARRYGIRSTAQAMAMLYGEVIAQRRASRPAEQAA
jgi:glycosyltransferase involved in cell wall biosynthesis